MYARIVDCTIRPGKKGEFTETLNGEVLSLLRKQRGFQDVIGLWSEKDPNRAVAISLWDGKENAENYYKHDYKKVLEILTPLITGQPRVETFEVDTSTSHRIARGRAA
jgi:heme-degrading monooxygenase HmoA